MKCPDIDRLIEYHAGRNRSETLEDHLRQCSECRGLLFVIQEISEAYELTFRVPEPLIQAILSDLPQPERRQSRHQVFIAGVLGAATVLGSLLLSGTIGSAGGFGSLLASGIGGIASSVLYIRAHGEPFGEPIEPLPSG